MSDENISRQVLVVRDAHNADWSATERAIDRLDDDTQTVDALDYEIEKIRQIQCEGWDVPRLFNAWVSLAGGEPIDIDEIILEMTRVILRDDLDRVRAALSGETGGIVDGPDCEGFLQKGEPTVLEMEIDLVSGAAPLDGLYDSLRRLNQFRVVQGEGIDLLYEI